MNISLAPRYHPEVIITMQKMSEQNLTYQEVEECTTLKEKVRESVKQVRAEYDDFKEKVNTLVDSS